tara:strand:- start:584 stop:1135 length:552 start_codon:yes stop_codon:yes gene_type:complete
MINLINIITISRIIIALIIFYLFTRNDSYLLILILFFIAGISDYLDGYLARKYNLVSSIGEILDPIADKILIVFLFFGLAINLSSYLIGFAGSIIIARELWVSALRDFNARNSNLDATRVTFLAKIKTTIQLFTILIYLIGLSTQFMLLIVLADILLVIATLVTIYTGINYTNNTFKKNTFSE